MISEIKYAGILHITLRGSDGEIKAERHEKNVLTDIGKTYLIQHTMNSELTAMTVFYIGSTASAGAAAAADTTGETTEEARAAFTYVTGATVGRCSATCTFAASGASANNITEAGIFNGLAAANSGDGILFARAIFSAVAKASADSIEIKWDVVYS